MVRGSVWSFGGSLLVLALWQQRDSIRCLSLCLAGMAILPFFDGSYPWEMGLALGLFLVRSLDLLPETIQEKRMQITEYSIQEAIDSLEEGVLISLASGEPVLMNRALFRYTESVLGVGIRNSNMLWHLLQEVRRPGLHRENQGRGCFSGCRTADGCCSSGSRSISRGSPTGS